MRNLENLLSDRPARNGTFRPLGFVREAERIAERRAMRRDFLRFHARAPFVVALLVVVVASIALPALLGLPLIGAVAKGVR